MISLVIPVYNIKKYIVRCLDSVVRQTSQNFECVIVVDGATDGSGEICDRYALQYANFRVVHQPNKGLLAAVCAGIEAATGEYIMFLDGDDFIAKEAVQLVQNIIEETSCDLIAYDFYKYYSDEKIKEISLDIASGLLEEENALAFVLSHHMVYARWNKVIKKSILMSILPYVDKRVTIGEDISITLPSLYSAKTAFYLKKPLIYYCQNDSSFTHVYKENYFESCKYLYSVLQCYFRDTEYNKLPDRIFFNNIKTLLQRIALMFDGNKRKEMQRLLEDKATVQLLKIYAPNSKKDKLLKILMQLKMTLLLRMISILNIKVLKRWE